MKAHIIEIKERIVEGPTNHIHKPVLLMNACNARTKTIFLRNKYPMKPSKF
jgi:hypothetical protein